MTLHDTSDADRLINRAELCLWLGIQPRTLDEWQRQRIAPPAIHLTARSVRYRVGDVRRWLAERQRAA